MPFVAMAQEEEVRPLRLEGRIVNDQQQAVSYAHIINLRRNIGTISDYNGFFAMGSYPGDTLTITAVSYDKLYFVIPDITEIKKYAFVLVMEQDTVLLTEQVIYPWPESFEEFKDEFLEMRTKDTVSDIIGFNLIPEGELRNYAYPEGGIRVQGPLGFLYSRFSKEAKRNKEFENVRIQDKIKSRYNPELVSRITGLTDKVEINRLMDYCDLKPEFVFKSTDYDLYSAILRCYREFIKFND